MGVWFDWERRLAGGSRSWMPEVAAERARREVVAPGRASLQAHSPSTGELFEVEGERVDRSKGFLQQDLSWCCRESEHLVWKLSLERERRRRKRLIDSGWASWARRSSGLGCRVV